MSKILILDPYFRKFTADMERWWIKHGHEVRIDRYWNPEIANEWADVIWFDTIDNNIKSATNPGEAIIDDNANYMPWDLHHMDLSKKHVIARAIDIEVWYGHQEGTIWDVVDDLVFIAPHIKDLTNIPVKRQHVIPCGIDIDRYNFDDRHDGFNIAVISEKWTSKGTDLILQIAYKLKQIDDRYKIHWLGKWSDYPWEIKYFEEFIKHNELNFEFTEWIEGDNAVNQFLEGKNYFLHASHKEAFSYATAEAMAKGIKPIIHRFYGADDLWPGITWSSIDEATDMITDGEYDSTSYRRYLINKGYTVNQMMNKINAIIEGGK